jgi:hypothetical protein
MFAFANGAVKKVLASSEMGWHSQKELLRSVGKFRNVSAFAKGADNKCWHRNVLASPEGAVNKLLASLQMCWHLLKERLIKC